MKKKKCQEWFECFSDAKSQNATFPVHSLRENQKVRENNEVSKLTTIAAYEKSQQIFSCFLIAIETIPRLWVESRIGLQ